jgi:glycosyltransferase involved in cell wall biosynthesis
VTSQMKTEQPNTRVPDRVQDGARLSRILFVIGGEHIGGSELHLLRLLPYLKDEFRVGICCINGGARFLDHLRVSTVETFNLAIPDLKSASRVLRLKDLRGVMRRFVPDIVHSYGFTADVLAPIFSLECRSARVVGTRRGQDAKRRHQFLRSLTNPLCDRVVCVSEATAEFVRRTERIDASALRVIPNGVAPRTCLGSKQRDGRTPVRFGTVGRVMPVKGTDILLEAFLKFDQHASVELHIAGRVGNLWAEQLVSRAAASPHGERIRFVGFAADPDAFLAELDVFVLPSRSEGMSNALLEAMACGLPCIATDVGSNATLLRGHGDAGLVCEPTASDLYGCMVELQHDEALRARLASTARRVVDTEYSMHKMIESYRQLYLELLTH